MYNVLTDRKCEKLETRHGLVENNYFKTHANTYVHTFASLRLTMSCTSR